MNVDNFHLQSRDRLDGIRQSVKQLLEPDQRSRWGWAISENQNVNNIEGNNVCGVS